MVSSVFGILWWRVSRLQCCCMTMFAFVAFTIVCKREGQIPVQRYVALVHAEAMCLRCVCVVLEALLAWCGVLVVQRFSWFPSLPPSAFLVQGLALLPVRCFGGLFTLLPLGFWPQCDRCYSWGLGAGGLVAGLRVGKPVGVLPPLDVIAVAAPWPMGTQPPLAIQVLTIIII